MQSKYDKETRKLEIKFCANDDAAIFWMLLSSPLFKNLCSYHYSMNINNLINEMYCNCGTHSEISYVDTNKQVVQYAKDYYGLEDKYVAEEYRHKANKYDIEHTKNKFNEDMRNELLTLMQGENNDD